MKHYNSILHGSPRAWAEQELKFKGGGGGGGGTQTSTTTQSASIDPMLKPYVTFGLNEAQRLYGTGGPAYYPGQTYIGPSAQTQTAMGLAEQRALSGSPLVQGAQQQQQGTIGGAYLGNNPYLGAAMQGAGQAAAQQYYDAINKANTMASQAGRYGSGAQGEQYNRANTAFANALASKAGDLMYQNYSSERARQEAAAAGAPQLAQADYTDINQLYNIGQTQEQYQQAAMEDAINRYNYQQNLPYQNLSTFLSSVYGAPQGQVATTSGVTRGGGGGKIVCTMMNEEYGFGSFRNKIWLDHSATMPNAKVYEKGYHTVFLPLIAFAKRKGKINYAVKKTLEHIARHRTADIWKQKHGKRDTLGAIYRAILEPICYVVGKVKGV